MWGRGVGGMKSHACAAETGHGGSSPARPHTSQERAGPSALQRRRGPGPESLLLHGSLEILNADRPCKTAETHTELSQTHHQLTA